MYCASETCSKLLDNEKDCFECVFHPEINQITEAQIDKADDCPGQLFFSFFYES